MAEIVIKVEDLSKQYRLGEVSTGTLSHDINKWWHRIRGKEDPYLKIGEENDRTKKGGSDYVWALQNINFEVQKGDVVGIIGRNGAGKSTLLKILSRTTLPTTGSIKVKGRIASLLEVGTGFHPELTGRDNIYLNGAILGMTRQEIKRKFDEIVSFSGVEKYIDTPVKRYSSGMYVRLAFGVAAHLEPEILIVDEVLAVGDIEFQRKALGKMKSISTSEGRTVLFVSHNMSAIGSLCNSGILMQNGKIEKIDKISPVINHYFFLGIDRTFKHDVSKFRNYNIDASPIIIKDVYIKGYPTEVPALSMNDKITFVLKVQVRQKVENASIALAISNAEGIATDLSYSWDDNFYLNIEEPGEYEIECTPGQLSLPPGRYTIGLGINQSYNTMPWDGLGYYPIFEIENRYNVKFWDFRPWAAHHLANNKWTINKIYSA
jgi:lipopolysaccharide transport system ATP-binding protein